MICNKMKKIFATLFLMAFIVNMLPTIYVSAENYSGSCGENVNYSFNESTGELIISGKGNMEDYGYYMFVPWYRTYCFRHLIEHIVIKDGVTSIGQWSFAYCSNLRSIKIPKSVTSIGDRAFESCTSLASIDIPENLIQIGSCAFNKCTRLNSIIIPKSVTTIGDFAFADCERLKSLTYLGTAEPNSGRFVFKSCEKLFEVNVPVNYKGAHFCGVGIKRVNVSKILKDSKKRTTLEDSLILSDDEDEYDNSCCCNVA